MVSFRCWDCYPRKKDSEVTMEYAMTVFGSYARHDFDAISDKDMLFIYKTNSYPKNEILKMKYAGWNCAEYTYKDFLHIAKIGSLFVQHIKQDGIITHDNNNILKNILREYTPKDNYNREICNTIDTFNIIKYVEDSARGILWALDVISVLFRNYCILNLANNKIYEFSSKKIYKIIQDFYKLSSYDYMTICTLRHFKHIYRNQQNADYKYVKQYFYEIIDILSKKIKIPVNSSILPQKQFLSQQSSLLSIKYPSGYKGLRLFESIYNIRHNNIQMRKYKEFITNPSKYSYTFQYNNLLERLSFSNALDMQ